MNLNPRPLPSFSTLYWGDRTLRSALHGTISGLVVAAGFWWLQQPVPNALPQAEPPIELVLAPWICLAGLVFAALAALVLIRRYLFVKEILCHGATVQGTLEEIDTYSTTSQSTTSHGSRTTTRTYVYYISLRYAVHGIDQQVGFKLMHSPSTYGLAKDRPVELNVLDSKPNQPLIRALFKERPTRRRRSLWTL